MASRTSLFFGYLECVLDHEGFQIWDEVLRSDISRVFCNNFVLSAKRSRNEYQHNYCFKRFIFREAWTPQGRKLTEACCLRMLLNVPLLPWCSHLHTEVRLSFGNHTKKTWNFWKYRRWWCFSRMIVVKRVRCDQWRVRGGQSRHMWSLEDSAKKGQMWSVQWSHMTHLTTILQWSHMTSNDYRWLHTMRLTTTLQWLQMTPYDAFDRYPSMTTDDSIWRFWPLPSNDYRWLYMTRLTTTLQWLQMTPYDAFDHYPPMTKHDAFDQSVLRPRSIIGLSCTTVSDAMGAEQSNRVSYTSCLVVRLSLIVKWGL